MAFFREKKVNMYVRITITNALTYVLENFDFACAKKWLMK